MIKNLTPHPVTLLNSDGSLLCEIEPSGLARLAQKTVSSDFIGFDNKLIPTSESSFGEATGLPDPEQGVYLIVSQMIKSALPNRADLLVPAEVVRSLGGAVLGCKSLGR